MLRLICAAIVLLALFAPGASAQRSGSPGSDAALKEAVEYFVRGSRQDDRDRAITDYSEAIRLNPKFTQAYHSRGAAWMAKGELDRAIADFTETIRLYPKFVAAYKDRAECWYAKGDFDRAIADYTEAIQLGQTHLLYERAYAWHRKGEFDKAIADYTAAIARNPAHPLTFEFRRAEAMKKQPPSEDR